ncbi:MAG TPA: hypothetical protein VHD61_10315 [Lacunisphaera sp.]|nr:hypothetical protein [Lacunisphaera sp.]
MIRRALLALAGLVTLEAGAAVVVLRLPYPELRLKDGTVLNEVTIQSFNTTAGTATLRVKNDLMSVQTTLLPDAVQARLKELTPALSKEAQEAEKARDEAGRKRGEELADRHQKQVEEEAKANREASRALNLKTAEQQLTHEDRTLDEVIRVAEEQARRYFKYEDAPFSNIGAVTGADLYLEDPEPVPGWTGRYRVRGTAYRQYLNNQASGYGRDTREFEMLIQTYDRKKPKVVDLTVK